MNRKLKRLIEEEERTVAKIEEMQGHLKDIRIARKQEEDTEIVRSIRTMKLGARELFELLSGIQNGSVSIETLPLAEDEPEEPELPDVQDTELINQNEKGANDAPESEDMIHE